MRMTKIRWISTIVLFAVLPLLVFSSCNKNEELESNPNTYEVSSTATSNDKSIDTASSYIQGTFTESSYYSEWLNLRLEIPSGFQASPDTIKAYNESQDREIVEMMIDGEKQSLQISVIKSKIDKSLNQYAEEYKENVEEGDQSTMSKIQGFIIERAWTFDTYSLVGTEYLLLCSETNSYLDGKLYKKSTSWNLFRQIDNYFVHIQSIADNQNAIENLLSKFTSYADGTDFSSDIIDNDINKPEPTSPQAVSSEIQTETYADSTVTATGTIENDVYKPEQTSFQAASSDIQTETYADRSDASTGTIENDIVSNTDDNTSNDPCKFGHSWVAETQTVHHDATGHYETVTDAKKVNKYRCSVCYNEHNTVDEYYLHFDSVHGDDNLLRVAYRDRYEIVERWEYYDTQQWVVDSEAYDETVIIGYECIVCGKRANS